MIHDHDSLERSTGLAKEALDKMGSHRIAPCPLNYTVWYAHCSGNYPDLSKALERKVSTAETFSRDVNQDLFDRFFGIELESSVIRETGNQLHSSLEEVLSLVAEGGRETGAYGQTLAGMKDSLADRSDPADTQRVVQMILGETQKMVEKSKTLEDSLKASATEIQSLRDHMEQLREEAMTDALTGVANRKCFEIRLAEAAAETEETGVTFSLLLCDIDHFKKFNDSFGHKVGDEVLKVVGRHLQAGVKGRDTAARYGGEEFALILPQTELGGAASLGEALREGLAKKELKNRKTDQSFGRITLSVGAGTFRPGEDTDDLVRRADEALYLAKRNGRDRVETEAGLEKSQDEILVLSKTA